MTPEASEKIKDEDLAQLLSDYREPLVAICRELQHQQQKWGKDKPQALAGFLLILESELEEAKRGWIKDSDGRNSPLAEVVQVAAVALACLARYGTMGNSLSTNDVTEAEMREMRRIASEKRWGAA